VHSVVAERASGADICFDTFHVIGWVTDAVDEVRRQIWHDLQHADKNTAKAVKGVRWILLRNWANLTRSSGMRPGLDRGD
jgi:transposase